MWEVIQLSSHRKPVVLQGIAKALSGALLKT